MDSNKYDVIIIGGGPAGLTAGIYLSRSKVKTLIIDQGMIGGQMVLSYEIANYPGVENTSGFQLAKTMKKQAKSFGCDIKSNIKLSDICFKSDPKTVTINDSETYSAKAIIWATGGRSRSLHVPGEDRFKGKGISYCATCDGDFFQDKEIIVVGGGNSALEEAVSLTKYASKLTIVHEFDHFQAFEHAVEQAKQNPKIEYIMESHLVEFFGADSLEGVKIKNLKTGRISEKKIDGVFIFVGYEANNDFLKGKEITLNNRNEVIINENYQTNVSGVFAAGDNLAKRYRQITTAVADGTIAALNAIEFIHNK
ncbi:MAG: pyridine nucleotide-disulfide oxidoreductase [Bacteroidetes bacterium 4484_249]|nr:MAG: pyridine nucleotide-disulfide oxidoreductase [Bacteroidetes bacterium 4484_249]